MRRIEIEQTCERCKGTGEVELYGKCMRCSGRGTTTVVKWTTPKEESSLMSSDLRRTKRSRPN